MSQILDDELVRATPGLRLFSVGILTVCRKLGLKIASGESAESNYRELLTVAWLLDERHELPCIKRFADLEPNVRADMIDFYEFGIEPAFLMRVKAEIARTNRAVELAAGFTIEPKPGAREGPQPVGKSSSPPGS